MRLAIAAAAIVLAACSADAQQMRRYDFYIYNSTGAPDVYAVEGAGHAAAVEVRSCGDARLLADAAATVVRLRALRTRDDVSVVTIIGPSSQTHLGPCGGVDNDADKDEEEDAGNDQSLVIIQGASAAQTARTINTLDAAPEAVRAEMISALGLR